VVTLRVGRLNICTRTHEALSGEAFAPTELFLQMWKQIKSERTLLDNLSKHRSVRF